MFVPAGVHHPDIQCHQLDRLAQAGADLFEIGLPCANPALDGRLIRSAYHRARSSTAPSVPSHTPRRCVRRW
ncbi:tryptophan synthase subunit alpha [Micromonospora tulbaghiae]|uniref:tryptophan synthase subunit alpha n=1 Tax=Micromonospora tulbaghiae TaxID=479978 RepID=UPI003666B2FA